MNLKIPTALALFFLFFIPLTGKTETRQKPETDFLKLSQDFLRAATTKKSTANYISSLKNLNLDLLDGRLSNDNKRLAFWLNIYNGFIQAQLSKNPKLFENRNAFFGNESINIGGKLFSFDLIEHGIMRRSKVKLGLGHVNKVLPGALERQFRVDKLDYRIHFALNCGAKSCPPVRVYQAEKIDSQLQAGTSAYLKKETRYDKKTNTVYVTSLIKWFRGDFGSGDELYALLQKLELIPANSKPEIKYQDYDWTLDLDNYNL